MTNDGLGPRIAKIDRADGVSGNTGHREWYCREQREQRPGGDREEDRRPAANLSFGAGAGNGQHDTEEQRGAGTQTEGRGALILPGRHRERDRRQVRDGQTEQHQSKDPYYRRYCHRRRYPRLVDENLLVLVIVP